VSKPYSSIDTVGQGKRETILKSKRVVNTKRDGEKYVTFLLNAAH